MDILKTAMRIIFVEQDPYEIMRKALQGTPLAEYHDGIASMSKNEFVDDYLILDSSRMWDEASNILDVVRSVGDVWHLLYQYADEKLFYDGNMIYCNYKDLLKWVQITSHIEADLFVAAFLAKRENTASCARSNFSWPNVLPCNNVRLRNMLSRGLAENHFHLKGSADPFRLSWIALMNDVCICDNIALDKPAGRLAKDSQKMLDLQVLLAIAAIIRVYLFCRLLQGQDMRYVQLLKWLQEIIVSENHRLLLELHLADISSFIAIQDCQEAVCDYAITPGLYQGDKSVAYYAGERAFLYRCLLKLTGRKERNTKEAGLFLAYLVIKNKFMAELVQNNSRFGFTNFAKYQDRKGQYLQKDEVLRNLVEPVAVLASVKRQNIVSLEARVIPKDTAKQNRKFLMDLDARIENLLRNDDGNSWQLDGTIGNKLFYVFHFPKERDEIPHEGDYANNAIYFRHRKLRKKIKKWTNGIIKMREDYPDVAERVVGIDACANELDARPEVFGQAFRCLRHHVQNPSSMILHPACDLSNLRLTYHVGEDFLDLLDGLRAIEEAILFLGMTHGDRLGHAVALGINIDDWYFQKSYKVCLSKHDILDNIAWLIWHLQHDGYSDSFGLLGQLHDDYAHFWMQVYGQENVPHIDRYIQAWRLRGNNPLFYEQGEALALSYWDKFACNGNIVQQDEESPCLDLFKKYHSAEVARKGAEKCVYKVSKRVLPAIAFVQRSLQKEISARGIGIECNPTSNVRISNFARYDKHPILQMYNLGLVAEPGMISACPQLMVSINTDNQGILGTTLENEYALMALALEKKKDEYGMPVYKQAMIYDWLDRIRRMGLEQCFRSAYNK